MNATMLLEQTKHYPVMLDQVLSIISPQHGGTFIDCTFGGGGYSQAILKFTGTKVLAIDRDELTKEYANSLEKKFPKRFNFFQEKFSNLNQVELPPLDSDIADSSQLTGTLHYKYIPKTGGLPGNWGQTDVAYAVLTPAYTPNRVVTEMWRGEGEVVFHHARWEDLPTQYNIVNTLNQLEIREPRGASMVKSVGGKDLSDQRILK